MHLHEWKAGCVRAWKCDCGIAVAAMGEKLAYICTDCKTHSQWSSCHKHYVCGSTVGVSRKRVWKGTLLQNLGLMDWNKLTAQTSFCLVSGCVFSQLASGSCLGFYHISGASSNSHNVFKLWVVGPGQRCMLWRVMFPDLCFIKWQLCAESVFPWWSLTLISKTTLLQQDEGIFGLLGHVSPKLYHG